MFPGRGDDAAGAGSEWFEAQRPNVAIVHADPRAQRLPRPEALLQPQAQKLDELAERLRRGLSDRASRGRERLSELRLSPAVLERGLRDATRRLEGQRLTPLLATVRLQRERELARS